MLRADAACCCTCVRSPSPYILRSTKSPQPALDIQIPDFRGVRHSSGARNVVFPSGVGIQSDATQMTHMIDLSGNQSLILDDMDVMAGLVIKIMAAATSRIFLAHYGSSRSSNFFIPSVHIVSKHDDLSPPGHYGSAYGVLHQDQNGGLFRGAAEANELDDRTRHSHRHCRDSQRELAGKERSG